MQVSDDSIQDIVHTWQPYLAESSVVSPSIWLELSFFGPAECPQVRRSQLTGSTHIWTGSASGSKLTSAGALETEPFQSSAVKSVSGSGSTRSSAEKATLGFLQRLHPFNWDATAGRIQVCDISEMLLASYFKRVPSPALVIIQCRCQLCYVLNHDHPACYLFLLCLTSCIEMQCPACSQTRVHCKRTSSSVFGNALRCSTRSCNHPTWDYRVAKALHHSYEMETTAALLS